MEGIPEVSHVKRASRIAELNDRLRRTGVGGRTVMTRAVADLPHATRTAIIDAVRSFTAFTTSNDPHREHDFGKVELDGEQYSGR